MKEEKVASNREAIFNSWVLRYTTMRGHNLIKIPTRVSVSLSLSLSLSHQSLLSYNCVCDA